jgi:hypothetical protein
VWQRIVEGGTEPRTLKDNDFDCDGDRFTAGDLMMTTVLRILKHTDIVASDARLAADVARCTARPAFERARMRRSQTSKTLPRRLGAPLLFRGPNIRQKKRRAPAPFFAVTFG